MDDDRLDAATELAQEQLRRAGALVCDYSEGLAPDEHHQLVAAVTVAIALAYSIGLPASDDR